MAYKVKKGSEKIHAGAVLFDGKKIFNGTLSEATQEELEELFASFPKHIEKDIKTKRKKKKRDNDPKTELPKPPVNEPETNDKEDV